MHQLRLFILLLALTPLPIGCQSNLPTADLTNREMRSFDTLIDDFLDPISSGKIKPSNVSWADPTVVEVPSSEDPPALSAIPIDQKRDYSGESTSSPTQYGSYQDEDITLCGDNPDNPNCPPQPPSCKCQKGTITFNANTTNPFTIFPLARSPRPSDVADNRKLGPCVGSFGRVGGGIQFRVGNTFQVGFPLNGVNGCRSEQYLAEWTYKFNSLTNRLISGQFMTAPDGPPPGGLPAQNFFGNTQTGIRTLNNAAYYQGTPTTLMWWDAPGRNGNVIPGGSPIVEITLLALVSVVKNPDGTECKCYTFHIFALDFSQNGVAPNSKLRPLLTPQVLQRATLDTIVGATQNGAPPQGAANSAVGLTVIQGLVAPLLRQNPFFSGVCR